MRVMKAAVIIAAVLSAGLISACGRQTGSVIVAGSTSVLPYAEVLSEEYALIYPDEEIDVQGGGSAAGITAAESGAADIGMSSRNLSDEEKQLLWYAEIAKDGLAIIVNPKNPIQNLTIDQVRDIYALKIPDWGELGGPNAEIHVITREDGSGTRSSFESLVMGKQPITPRAIVQDSNGAVRQLVADDPDSIGFISLGLADSTVKAIKLDNVEASRENVLNGSYGLYRPFLFVTSKEPAGLVKQFIDYTLSPEGQKILTDNGLIPDTEGSKS